MTTRATKASLNHLDETGRARMVDVTDKPPSERVAVAGGRVDVSDELARAIRDDSLEKGDLLTVARIAGISAAKRTDELIPLCHSIPIDLIDVDVHLDGSCVRIRAEVRTRASTGVEMEALAGVMGAALTVIEMGKSLDRAMTIRDVHSVEKRGGRSGEYRRAADERTA